MKIIICGSMGASREMVEAEKELQKHGHDVVLPSFTHEYAGMDDIAEKLKESAKEKIEHNLIK